MQQQEETVGKALMQTFNDGTPNVTNLWSLGRHYMCLDSLLQRAFCPHLFPSAEQMTNWNSGVFSVLRLSYENAWCMASPALVTLLPQPKRAGTFGHGLKRSCLCQGWNC